MTLTTLWFLGAVPKFLGNDLVAALFKDATVVTLPGVASTNGTVDVDDNAHADLYNKYLKRLKGQPTHDGPSS